MKRFFIFAFFIFTAAHSDENNFSINDLEKYLNNIKEISADFSQVDKNGISEGSFSLNRPKKFMQMIYKTPVQVEITVKNHKVIQYDKELKEKTETSLHSSPLAFLLKSKIDLKKEIVISEIKKQRNYLFVKLCKKKSENNGAITLVFLQKPFSLVGWIILENKNDESLERSTEISLKNVSINKVK